MTGVLRLGGAMTDPTGGDLRAASGGRRNMPLVPLLDAMAVDPKAWLEQMTGDAEEWFRENLYGLPPADDALGVLRNMIDELHRDAINGQQAGTPLRFNVNRETVGH